MKWSVSRSKPVLMLGYALRIRDTGIIAGGEEIVGSECRRRKKTKKKKKEKKEL